MMILNGLKNFAKNLKYIIVPLGIVFLFVLFGLSAFINGSINAIKTMVEQVKEITASSSLDFVSFLKAIGDEFVALDWNDFFGALKTIGSSQWLSHTFEKVFQALISGVRLEDLAIAIATCIASIVLALVIALVLFILGTIVAYFVTRAAIQHSNAKSKLLRSILFGALETVGILAILAIMILLTVLWGPFIFFALILIVPAIECWHLAIAYWKYAYKKVKFTKIFNFKNVILSILTNIIIIILTCLITWLFSLFISNSVMFFIGLSIFEVMLATNAANIASYTKNYVETGMAEKEEAKKLEKAAKKEEKMHKKEETPQPVEEIKEEKEKDAK